MSTQIDYTPREKFWLWTIAIVGATLVNGAFIYGLLFREGAFAAALSNPISIAFMIEATLLLGLLAYLLRKWAVTNASPGIFVLLSLLGSMAFAIPAVLLWKRRVNARHVPAREP